VIVHLSFVTEVCRRVISVSRTTNVQMKPEELRHRIHQNYASVGARSNLFHDQYRPLKLTSKVAAPLVRIVAL
jgi:hypothetical protein